MEYNFDEIVAALKEDDNWSIPKEVRDKLLDGLAKSLLGA